MNSFLNPNIIFLLYAYGLQVTKVNLEEPLEPKRQENLVGLLRSLARPDLFSYKTETRVTAVSIRTTPAHTQIDPLDTAGGQGVSRLQQFVPVPSFGARDL